MKKIKNITASVRSQLLQIARSTGREFNALMLQFFQERFLYRLSISSFWENFALKGALLFQIYKMPASRPTTDIDFLGLNTQNSEENITEIFKAILTMQCDDGVIFDIESLVVEPIKKEDKYKGLRLYCVAYLGVAKRRIHFDIGFGDIITPAPVVLDYPVIIESQPIPEVLAYTPESAIAEKFEAIVSLGYFTSRIKDFYDIYYMAENYEFLSDTLNTAIKATFNNRLTNIANYKMIFSPKFFEDANKNTQWIAFISRLGINSVITFGDCLKKIQTFLTPILDDNPEHQRWSPENFRWEKL